VKAAFEANYECLGITCAEVGGLWDASTSAYKADAAPCTGASPIHASIAGYLPGSDVVDHSRVDLDQKAMSVALSQSPADYAAATQWYSEGGNSKNGQRTLQGFSTGARAKMYDGCPGCPYKTYSQFYAYYGDFDYADKWVSAALAGTNAIFGSGRGGADFATVSDDATRSEAAVKGSAYMNVWMYAIREFEDAIDDCISCTDGQCNEHSSDASVHAWDEGVAFYAGSLEGPMGDSQGVMPYRLAEKRCANFRTCGSSGELASGTSRVNYDLSVLFLEGANQLKAGDCAAVRPTVDQIVEKMAIPLVQGTLRYAYFVGYQGLTDLESKAEGAVFAASVLPLVHHCDTLSGRSDAATIYQAMRIGSVASGYWADVKAAFEANYECLGITCAEVGGLYYNGQYRPSASPCTDSSTTSPPPPSAQTGASTGTTAGTTIDSQLSTTVVVGVVVACSIAAISLIFSLVVVLRERQGRPVFVPVKGMQGPPITGLNTV